MKIFLLSIMLLLSFSAVAFDNNDLETLLRAKGKSLEGFKQRGSKVLFGEVTGHAPMSKVQVIFIANEAILKSEIESASYAGAAGDLSSLDSLRFRGQYILKSDIKAIIIDK